MKIFAEEEPFPMPEPPKARRFGELSLPEKLRFLWDYYKIRIFLGICLLLVLVTGLPSLVSPDKPLLYVAAVNVAIEDDLHSSLTQGYQAFRKRTGAPAAAEGAGKGQENGKDGPAGAKEEQPGEVLLATGLYLTDDTSSEAFTYSYASRIKLLGSIDDEALDVILLDQEAFDAFAQSGYLYDLSELSSSLPPLPLVSNIELREPEAQDRKAAEEPGSEKEGGRETQAKKAEGEEGAGKDEESEAEEESEEPLPEYIPVRYPMALDLTVTPAFQSYSGSVYAAILKNTPRLSEALAYLNFLSQAQGFYLAMGSGI